VYLAGSAGPRARPSFTPPKTMARAGRKNTRQDGHDRYAQLPPISLYRESATSGVSPVAPSLFQAAMKA
jgi:hypothetical protein